MITSFLSDENGATAIEYGLVVALVAVTAMSSFTFVGDGVGRTFSQIGETLITAAPSAPKPPTRRPGPLSPS